MIGISKLNSTFSELGMDPTFIQQAHRLGLQTIGDLMTINLDSLKKHPEFTYTWYADMLDLLKEQKLLKKFQGNQL